MVKVGDYVRIIGENIEGVVHRVNSKPCEHLVGKYGRFLLIVKLADQSETKTGGQSSGLSPPTFQ